MKSRNICRVLLKCFKDLYSFFQIKIASSWCFYIVIVTSYFDFSTEDSSLSNPIKTFSLEMLDAQP
jgi:hypothetical protein